MPWAKGILVNAYGIVCEGWRGRGILKQTPQSSNLKVDATGLSGEKSGVIFLMEHSLNSTQQGPVTFYDKIRGYEVFKNFFKRGLVKR